MPTFTSIALLCAGRINYLQFLDVITNFLTPWSRVLLETLTVAQLLNKFNAFYGSRRFIAETMTRTLYNAVIKFCTAAILVLVTLKHQGQRSSHLRVGNSYKFSTEFYQITPEDIKRETQRHTDVMSQLPCIISTVIQADGIKQTQLKLYVCANKATRLAFMSFGLQTSQAIFI